MSHGMLLACQLSLTISFSCYMGQKVQPHSVADSSVLIPLSSCTNKMIHRYGVSLNKQRTADAIFCYGTQCMHSSKVCFCLLLNWCDKASSAKS